VVEDDVLVEEDEVVVPLTQSLLRVKLDAGGHEPPHA